MWADLLDALLATGYGCQLTAERWTAALIPLRALAGWACPGDSVPWHSFHSSLTLPASPRSRDVPAPHWRAPTGELALLRPHLELNQDEGGGARFPRGCYRKLPKEAVWGLSLEEEGMVCMEGIPDREDSTLKKNMFF